MAGLFSVIPAQAGTHDLELSALRTAVPTRTVAHGGKWSRSWVPACAGMTALLFFTAAPALAAGARNTAPARTEIHLAVFGDDPCPAGVGDEIVVCARLPEAERYRVPKRLRDEKKFARPEQSWVARVRDIDTAGADLRPTACSAIGSGGSSGCFQKFMRDARAQKEADAAAASVVP